MGKFQIKLEAEISSKFISPHKSFDSKSCKKKSHIFIIKTRTVKIFNSKVDNYTNAYSRL